MLVATAVSFVVLLGVPACGEGTPSGPTGPTPVETPATVTGLEIRSPAAFADNGHRLAVGDTIPLTACARYSNDTETCGVAATWSSSAPDVATVDSDGSLTGVSPGEARISAVFERQSVALTVEVESRPEAPVTVTGLTIRGPRRLQVDETVSLTACARYSDDTEACDIGATWSSGATDVATADSEGNVTGIAPGDARISATFDNQTATVTVTVDPKSAARTWRGLTVSAEDAARRTTPRTTAIRSQSRTTSCANWGASTARTHARPSTRPARRTSSTSWHAPRRMTPACARPTPTPGLASRGI